MLESFIGGINKFGLPSHVCSDKGGENIEVAEFMVLSEERTGTLTLLEEVYITSDKFSIALYYEKTISGECNGTNNCYRETYKGFLC